MHAGTGSPIAPSPCADNRDACPACFALAPLPTVRLHSSQREVPSAKVKDGEDGDRRSKLGSPRGRTIDPTETPTEWSGPGVAKCTRSVRTLIPPDQATWLRARRAVQEGSDG